MFSGVWHCKLRPNRPALYEATGSICQGDAPPDAPIAALGLCLERMQSGNVSRSDVSACRRKWRTASIDVLPSFAAVAADIDKYYGSLDDESVTDDPLAGDDDPDSQSC